MAEIIQRQDPEEFSSIVARNSSRLPSREEKHGVLSRSNRKAICNATGPRTAQGKKRSTLNAIKHGLLSKTGLLQDESRVEYDVLLDGLLEDFQPQGKLETVLVESLATVLWRKRRLLQAETAEIEKVQFLNIDFVLQNKAGDLEYARLGGSSDVKHEQTNLPNLLRDAIEILYMHRMLFVADDSEAVESIRRTLKMMHGCETEGPQPYGWRQMGLILSKLLSDAEAKRLSKAEARRLDGKVQPDPKEVILEALGDEIMRLAKLLDAAAKVEDLKREQNLVGIRLPSQEASDRLIRYEAHLSRETDRILNRLERLQRMRKGHQLPPQLDINIT
jgi:hypothetical protein